MVNLLRFSILSWAVLALYAVAGCSAIVRADEQPVAKEKAKARARAALALASTEIVPVAAEPPMVAARAAAKAALKKCGESCPCGVCDCEACECCGANKAKPMPPAVAPMATPKRTVERLTYSQLAATVAKLPAGESIRVYVGQQPPESATGRIVTLTDAIPKEEQRVGVFRCWRTDAGDLQYESTQPASGGVRLSMAGRFYDRYADGELYWCVECNRGK